MASLRTRGRKWAWAAGILATLLLMVTAFPLYELILDEWCLRELRAAPPDSEEEERAIEKVTARASPRVVKGLIEALRHDVSLEAAPQDIAPPASGLLECLDLPHRSFHTLLAIGAAAVPRLLEAVEREPDPRFPGHGG